MSVDQTRALASALAAAIEASSATEAAGPVTTLAAAPMPAAATAAPQHALINYPTARDVQPGGRMASYATGPGGGGSAAAANTIPPGAVALRQPHLQSACRPSPRTPGPPSCLTRSRSFDSSGLRRPGGGSIGSVGASGARYTGGGGGSAAGSARGMPRPRFVGLGPQPHAAVHSAIVQQSQQQLQRSPPPSKPPSLPLSQASSQPPSRQQPQQAQQPPTERRRRPTSLFKGGGGGDRAAYWRGGMPGGGALDGPAAALPSELGDDAPYGDENAPGEGIRPKMYQPAQPHLVFRPTSQGELRLVE